MGGVTLAAAERAVKQVIASGQIGSWKLNEELGAGGFGVTWLATKKELDGSTVKAVIKLTQPELLVSRSEESIREGQRSFHKEFVVLRGLQNPHIARLLDGGIQETKTGVDVPWLALERVQGTSLREELSDGPLDEQHWLRLARDLFEALDAVHRAGLVHLDVKPDNIVLRARGAVLIDFGIAAVRDQAPQEGISGTPGFMAPEQLDGRTDASDASAAVDAFKAGVTLALAAQGRLPWPLRAREPLPEMRRKLATRPDLTGLTETQRQVVEPLLSFKRELRPSARRSRETVEKLLAPSPSVPSVNPASAVAPVVAPVAAPEPRQPATPASPPAPPAAPAKAPQPSPSPAAPDRPRGGERGRTADIVSTCILLALGLFGAGFGLISWATFATSPDYSPGALPAVIGISHVLLFAAAVTFSIRQIKRKQLAFWIPLSAGIVASVIFVSAAAGIGASVV